VYGLSDAGPQARAGIGGSEALLGMAISAPESQSQAPAAALGQETPGQSGALLGQQSLGNLLLPGQPSLLAGPPRPPPQPPGGPGLSGLPGPPPPPFLPLDGRANGMPQAPLQMVGTGARPSMGSGDPQAALLAAMTSRGSPFLPAMSALSPTMQMSMCGGMGLMPQGLPMMSVGVWPGAMSWNAMGATYPGFGQQQMALAGGLQANCRPPFARPGPPPPAPPGMGPLGMCGAEWTKAPEDPFEEEDAGGSEEEERPVSYVSRWSGLEGSGREPPTDSIQARRNYRRGVQPIYSVLEELLEEVADEMAWDVAKEVFVKARPAAAKAWDALAARLLRTPAPKELAEMLRGEKPRIVELSTAQDGDDAAETSVGTPSQTVSPQGTAVAASSSSRAATSSGLAVDGVTPAPEKNHVAEPQEFEEIVNSLPVQSFWKVPASRSDVPPGIRIRVFDLDGAREVATFAVTQPVVIGSDPERAHVVERRGLNVYAEHVGLVYTVKGFNLHPISGQSVLSSLRHHRPLLARLRKETSQLPPERASRCQQVLDGLEKESTPSMLFQPGDGRKKLSQQACVFSLGRSERIYFLDLVTRGEIPEETQAEKKEVSQEVEVEKSEKPEPVEKPAAPEPEKAPVPNTTPTRKSRSRSSVKSPVKDASPVKTSAEAPPDARYSPVKAAVPAASTPDHRGKDAEKPRVRSRSNSRPHRDRERDRERDRWRGARSRSRRHRERSRSHRQAARHRERDRRRSRSRRRSCSRGRRSKSRDKRSRSIKRRSRSASPARRKRSRPASREKKKDRHDKKKTKKGKKEEATRAASPSASPSPSSSDLVAPVKRKVARLKTSDVKDETKRARHSFEEGKRDSVTTEEKRDAHKKDWVADEDVIAKEKTGKARKVPEKEEVDDEEQVKEEGRALKQKKDREQKLLDELDRKEREKAEAAAREKKESERDKLREAEKRRKSDVSAGKRHVESDSSGEGERKAKKGEAQKSKKTKKPVRKGKEKDKDKKRKKKHKKAASSGSESSDSSS